jgi:sigma-B regulation protein RsbU (phosphoserine phosphatase)
MIASVSTFLRRQHPAVLTLAGLLAIGALGMLDYLAGPDLSFLIFYVAPVLFLVWFVGRWAGLLGAAASAAFWVYEDVLSTHAYSSTTVADWNIAVRLIFLSLFVYVVAELKGALERERLAEQERLEREVRIARQVQSRLFPQKVPEIQGLDCHGLCLPAGGAAGDYYDFLALDTGHLGIAVGDVAGKGISAALLMASLQGALRSHASLSGDGPEGLARDINAQMHALTEPTRFATLFWGVFDGERRTLTYVNAGHNPPMLLRGASGIDRLRTGGPPLGVFAVTAYRQETVTLEPGDLLAVFTDGITEASNAAEEDYGDERLARFLRENAGRPAVELCRLVLEAVEIFRGGEPQADDMTIVVARFA